MAFGPLLALALMASDPTSVPAEDDLDGTWLATSAELGGKPFPDEVRKAIRLEIQGDRYTVTVGGGPDKGTCKRDGSAKPRALDITGTEGPNQGKTIPAIYERVGDKLKVCYNLGGPDRPKEFKTEAGTALFLVEYALQKP
ncbi:MAG: TIGR03067 domain-containing protein [Isosphaeraceae bacterium]